MIVDQLPYRHIHPIVCARRITLGILMVGFIAFNSHAQTYSLNNVKIQLLSKETLKGQLIRMTSDSLFLKMKGGKIKALNYRSVDFMKMRRSAGTTNGILIGAGAGLTVGLVVGVAAGDGVSGSSKNSYWGGLRQTSQSLELVGIGLMGAFAGGIIGAIIGSNPRKISIQGNQKRYDELRTQCLLSLWKQAEKTKRNP